MQESIMKPTFNNRFVRSLYTTDADAKIVLDYLKVHLTENNVITAEAVTKGTNLQKRRVFKVFRELDRRGRCGRALAGRGAFGRVAPTVSRIEMEIPANMLQNTLRGLAGKVKAVPAVVSTVPLTPKPVVETPAKQEEAKPMQELPQENILWIRDDLAIRLPRHLTEVEKEMLITMVRLAN